MDDPPSPPVDKLGSAGGDVNGGEDVAELLGDPGCPPGDPPNPQFAALYAPPPPPPPSPPLPAVIPDP